MFLVSTIKNYIYIIKGVFHFRSSISTKRSLVLVVLQTSIHGTSSLRDLDTVVSFPKLKNDSETILWQDNLKPSQKPVTGDR